MQYYLLLKDQEHERKAFSFKFIYYLT